MKEEIKKLIKELEEKVEIEDWWYVHDIADAIREKALLKIREVKVDWMIEKPRFAPTEMFVDERETFYFRIPDDVAKETGYPKNSWIAISGIPPNLTAHSSTHITPSEVPTKHIRDTLEALSKEETLKLLKESFEKRSEEVIWKWKKKSR